MSTQTSKECRDRSEIIADLEYLSQEDGFIYTFCLLVLKHLTVTIDNSNELKDWHQHLSTRELSFLLGLMVKHPLRLSVVPSQEVAQEQDNKAFELLGELHRSYLSSLRLGIEEQSSNLDEESQFSQAHRKVLESPDQLAESMFYAEDGGYDFQCIEFTRKRYARDRMWLESKLGASLEDILEIPVRLVDLTEDRIQGIHPPEAFEEFCQQVLSVFTFSREEIVGDQKVSVSGFLEAFACTPGTVNRELNTVGAYNAVLSHPLIHLPDGQFLLPIHFNLAQSLYESPFYWMSNDPAYENMASRNRGEAIEEIAYEMLKETFGDQNTYRGVKVLRGKDDVTDIDVLAVAGNKAVIVQAKSKKLTELSKQGNIESVKSDFTKAIQSAYDQALTCRESVINKVNTLRDSDGQIIELHEDLDDAYLICLTGDHYPSVSTQLFAFLQRRADDPYPLAMSLFDLDILTFYLTEPIDLLYYLRQRSTHSEHFFADCEMSFLAFHLRNKLYPSHSANVTYIDPSTAQLIDANFPVAKGHRPRTEVAGRLFHKWRNEDFDQLVEALKNTGIRGFTDAIFFLFDFAGKGADTIIRRIRERKQATHFDDDIHSVTIPIEDSGKGITFVSYPRKFASVQEQFSSFAQATKYRHRANEWLALGSIEGSEAFVDMFFYSREGWKFDSDMERVARSTLKHGTMIRGGGRKIGRNEPCLCGSGLKFKKCHGR